MKIRIVHFASVGNSKLHFTDYTKVRDLFPYLFFVGRQQTPQALCASSPNLGEQYTRPRPTATPSNLEGEFLLFPGIKNNTWDIVG